MSEARPKIGVAWKKTTRAGEDLITIAINEAVEKGARLVMFTNRYKETEKQPDFIIYRDQKADALRDQDQGRSDEGPSEDVPF